MRRHLLWAMVAVGLAATGSLWAAHNPILVSAGGGYVGTATGNLDLQDTYSIVNGVDVATDSITADATSGGITIGGTGATSAESINWKFGETANICDVSTATGVTLVDFGAINLATDALDLSDGNITNGGDLACDSITADATSAGVTIGGAGAASTESITFDPGETANQMDIVTATGVTLIDTGAIGFACGSIDLSSGNLTSGGDIGTTTVTATGAVAAGAASYHEWTGRARVYSPADGKVLFSNQAVSTDVCVDVTTDSTAKFYAGDCAAAAIVETTRFNGTNTGATGAFSWADQKSQLDANGTTSARWTTDAFSGTALPYGIDIVTGDQTNAGNYSGGTGISLETGATTTDGDTGDIRLTTGVAGVGAADAGDIVLQTHGTTRLTIEGNGGDLVVPSYDVDYVITAGSAVLGPTAPDFNSNDSCMGLAFDADAQAVSVYFEVPSCYADGDSDDLELKIYWCGDTANPAQNDVVKFDITYRSLVWGGVSAEDVDSGAAGTGTVSYVESADPGDVDDTHEMGITIDADDGTHPINPGDLLAIRIDRDWSVGSNYAQDAIVPIFEITVPQTSLLCDHNN